MAGADETAVSEITLLPDGRVYVFGMSRQLLEVLETMGVRDPRVRALLRTVHEELAAEEHRGVEERP